MGLKAIAGSSGGSGGAPNVSTATGILAPAHGGTGVANQATVTITGNHTLGITLSNDTSVTLPTSGTLLSTASVIGPANGGTGVVNDPANTVTFTGAHALGLTLTADTSVTLPTSGTLVSSAGTIANATNVTVANEATDTTCFPLFATDSTGNLGAKSNAGLTFNSNTGLLTATTLAGPVKGTATNDSAASGNVGEFVSSTVLAAAQVALTTATPANITSISLTAGDWDVSGTVVLNPAATTNVANPLAGWMSSTSATLPTLPNAGGIAESNAMFYVPAAVQVMPVGVMRMSLASTTTVYLSISAAFSVSTCGAYGFISARRMR